MLLEHGLMKPVFGLKPKMGKECVHHFRNGSVWKAPQKTNVMILFLVTQAYTGQAWMKTLDMRGFLWMQDYVRQLLRNVVLFVSHYYHRLVNTFFAYYHKNLPNCLAVREILFIFAVG